MDWQKIIEVLIQYFSWPITILIIILIYKDKFGRIVNFKARDYEISFENEIKSVKKDIMPESKNIIKNDTHSTVCAINSTAFLKDNMLLLSEKSPLGVVLQAWGNFEHVVVESAAKKGFTNTNNPSAAIQYLYEKKYIDIDFINGCFRMYAIKERLSHLDNKLLTKELALENADIVLSVVSELQKIINKSENNQ